MHTLIGWALVCFLSRMKSVRPIPDETIPLVMPERSRWKPPVTESDNQSSCFRAMISSSLRHLWISLTPANNAPANARTTAAVMMICTATAWPLGPPPSNRTAKPTDPNTTNAITTLASATVVKLELTATRTCVSCGAPNDRPFGTLPLSTPLISLDRLHFGHCIFPDKVSAMFHTEEQCGQVQRLIAVASTYCGSFVVAKHVLTNDGEDVRKCNVTSGIQDPAGVSPPEARERRGQTMHGKYRHFYAASQYTLSAFLRTPISVVERIK